MAPLTSEKRKALPNSAFAIPEERKYPIDTKARARNALARVSAFGTPSQKKRVRNAVHDKYPGVGRMERTK